MSVAFHKPTIDEVLALIQKELRDIPLRDLMLEVNHNRDLQPIYTDSGLSLKIPYLLDYHVIFQLFTLTPSASDSNNQDLLKALENGQNGLILDFKNKDWELADIQKIFSNIRLDYIHTEFLNLTETTESMLRSFLLDCPHELSWSSYAFSNDIYCIASENFYSSSANFIKSFQGDKAFIHMELSGDYFLDIARIRAFKTMLYQHRKLQGLDPHFIIIGDTNTSKKTLEMTENNLIKLTTEAMSAITGGCEALWIKPHDHNYNSDFSQRLVRNIFHILQEEAYMHLVKDVSSGSYFIEEYTEAVAREIYASLHA